MDKPLHGRLFVRASAKLSEVGTLSRSIRLLAVGYGIPYEMVSHIYVLCLSMKDGIIDESDGALAITIKY